MFIVTLINGQEFVIQSGCRRSEDLMDWFHRNPWPLSLTVVGKSLGNLFDEEDYYTLAVRGSHVVSVRAL